MNNNRSFEAFDFQVIILSVVFIGMAVFTVLTAVGKFAFDNNISNYLFLALGFIILTVSFGLLLSIPKYKVLNIILISIFVCFTALTFIKKESIKAWFVGFNYSNVEQSMLAGTADVLDTPIYKEFLMDKNNRNVNRLKEYQNNPKQYTSINIEQVTNLRMFYASINNNDIKTKLNNMFNDNIVTQAEYADFQKFIATTNLDDKEVALLSIVTN
jgi:hypothetical protein